MKTTEATNGLDISAINPRNGAKYSPNLYQWLTSRYRKHREHTSKVYRNDHGTMWIGFYDQFDCFIGQKLVAVLCTGAKAESGCWDKLTGLTEIADFWPRYMRDGRCAIDTEHKMFFLGDETRWKVDGDCRQCMWCGNARQVLRRWTKTVECSEWVNGGAA